MARAASQRSAAATVKNEELEIRRMSGEQKATIVMRMIYTFLPNISLLAPVQNPPKLSSRPSKTPSTNTRAGNSSGGASSPSSVSPPGSRPSSVLRPAGMTATVRARAERAKAQQQQLEQQKAKEAQLNSVKTRLRQQAKPALDWDAIKRERRRTMPPTISSTATGVTKETS